VRGQVAGVADNVPFLAWEYQGGRSLRYIVDRARGGNGTQARPGLGAIVTTAAAVVGVGRLLARTDQAD
jgi:hypothetical protein